MVLTAVPNASIEESSHEAQYIKNLLPKIGVDVFLGRECRLERSNLRLHLALHIAQVVMNSLVQLLVVSIPTT